MVSVFLVSVLELVAAVPAGAQTAGMLSFQGLLKNAGGVPVNGPVTLQFRIYDAQTGGALVDMDGSGVVEDVVGKDAKQVSATAAKGIVSTKFGPVSAKAFNGQPRWLEVRVNGTALSRTEMATAAATAEQVNGPGSGSASLYTLADGSLRTRGKDDNTYISLYAEGSIGVRTSGYSGARFVAKDLRDGADAEAGLYLYLGSDPDTVNDVAILNSGGELHFHAPLGAARMIIAKNGDVIWGRSSLLGGDQGGTIELGHGTNGMNPWSGGRPYIDFHYGNGRVEDYNVRIINCEDGMLRVAAQRFSTSGQAIFPVVQITGGSDLAEPFVVASDEATKRRSDEGEEQAPDGAGGGPAANSQRDTRDSQLASPQPGMVVVIDPANPGRLKLASTPYDRKVAGVISGANGLKPGMVMAALSDEATKRRSDEGKTETLTPSLSLEGRGGGADEHPVALTGRVYVWADASYGRIEPGDMLTTSATPGHAMKATDRERSFGAVIGKAMSNLDKGKGLVLLLIQPR